MTIPSPLRIFLAIVLTLHAAFAMADDTPKDLSDDYHDLERCMERTMGRNWADHFGVARVVNPYGVLEATKTAVDTAPQVVRITDMSCRLQVGLQEEQRPSLP